MTDKTILSNPRRAVSNAGYEFDADGYRWVLSRNTSISVEWVYKRLTQPLKEGYLKTLRWYAENKSDAHTKAANYQFRNFCRFSKVSSKITSSQILNYRSSFNEERRYQVGRFRTLLRHWDELGHPGIPQDVLDLMDEWRIKGNRQGEAVANRCPISGPLTQFELQSLYDGAVDAYAASTISLTEYLLIRLIVATGRRPAQISDLKACDFQKVSSNDGKSHQYFLSIPRRKQRGIAWRGKFRWFAITHELGCLIEQHIHSTTADFLKATGGGIGFDAEKLVPLFPRWDYTAKESAVIVTDLLSTEYYHLPSTEVSRRFSNAANSKVQAYSERTKSRLKVTPLRLRRTKGTSAAREGYGVLAIAEILDHSDASHAHIYTENGPETAAKIDKKIAAQLAPYAQAFTGNIVKDASEAPRGDDPGSVVRTSSTPVGNCGKFGYCGAYAPIACYTCQRFNPWLYAPHQEVLDSLLKDREKVLLDTGDETIASANDRTILAVTRVIQLCEEKKQSMEEADND
ncbi:site-specific integrase [Vibrio sp. E150_011]